MLGPDGGERAETTRSLNVTDNTDDNHGRCLDNCAGLDNFLLVHLRAWTVKVANNCGHAGLVAHGGSEVNGLLGVILGEAVGAVLVPALILSLPDCPMLTSSPFLCDEQRAFAGGKPESRGGALRTFCCSVSSDLSYKPLYF